MQLAHVNDHAQAHPNKHSAPHRKVTIRLGNRCTHQEPSSLVCLVHAYRFVNNHYAEECKKRLTWDAVVYKDKIKEKVIEFLKQARVPGKALRCTTCPTDHVSLRWPPLFSSMLYTVSSSRAQSAHDMREHSLNSRRGPEIARVLVQ